MATVITRTLLSKFKIIKCSKRFIIIQIKNVSHKPNKGESVLPYKGIRMLDLTRVLAGPFSTQLMGDLGAEVIKIEHPNSGDITREWGPPFTEKGKESAYFLSCNRNKKSLTVDIKTDEGQKILHELVSKSDVLVENFVPETLRKYKLDYEHIHNHINPNLIYCSITGFSSSGPYSHKAGYDVIVQAMGGLMDITGDETPCKSGVALIDIITGLYSHSAILSALKSREIDNDHLGQKIDVNLMDSCITSLVNLAMAYLVSDKTVIPKRMGTAHPQIVPYEAFDTKIDGEYFVIGAGTDASFEKMCNLMQLQPLYNDEKFKTNAQRVKHREELIEILNKKFKEKTLDEWDKIFEKSNIPNGPVNNIQRAFNDKHIKEKNIVQYIQHPTAGTIPQLRLPVEYSKDVDINKIKLAPPTLGQHTEQILKDILGYDDEWIKMLCEKGVVSSPKYQSVGLD